MIVKIALQSMMLLAFISLVTIYADFDINHLSQVTSVSHEHHYHYMLAHRRAARRLIVAEMHESSDGIRELLMRGPDDEGLVATYKVTTTVLSKVNDQIVASSAGSSQIVQGGDIVDIDLPLEQEEVTIHHRWTGMGPRLANPCLPSLLTIGTQKGGTTSWHVYLKRGYHPHILVPQGLKETNYFNKYIERGQNMSSYLEEFPGISDGFDGMNGAKCELKHADSNVDYVRAEASPNYLVHPFAAARAHQSLPAARILIMLRSPISRLVSAYNMKWQERICGDGAWKRADCFNSLISADTTLESLQTDWEWGLREYVNGELAILTECHAQDRQLISECLRMSEMDSVKLFRHLEDRSHLYRSMYVEQIESWLKEYPANSIMIWSSEEFEANPKKHMRHMVEALQLDTSLIDDSFIADAKAHTRKYISEIPEDLRNRLERFFRPHNERLFYLLETHGYHREVDELRQHF